MSILVTAFVIVVGLVARRFGRVWLTERRNRRRRLEVTLTDLQLQRMTYLALSELLDEARRSLSDLDPRR